MSLLMDALRKAELEKKKAAERLEQTVEQAHVQEGDDTIAENQPGPEAEISSEHLITRMDRTHVRSKEEIFAATAQLSLEPIERIIKQGKPDEEKLDMAARILSEDLTINTLTDKLPEEHEVEPVDVTDTVPFPKLELTEDASGRTDEMEVGTDLPLDESFHDEVIGVKREIPGIYDETIQGEAYRAPEPERAYDETLPGVSALELARDLGEENQPTPVAAQTVFTATATRQATFHYKWPIIIGLVVVVVVASSIIIYQAITPLVNKIPEQQLAGDLDLKQPQLTRTTPPVLPESGTVQGVESVRQEPEQPVAQAPVTPEVTAQSTVEAATEPALETDKIEEQPQTTAEAEVVAKLEQPTAKEPPLSELPKVPDAALIKISRSKAADPRGKVLNEAYAAFQNGDLDGARTRYEEAVRLFPDNRDAMLGLGAIAMKEGDLARGYEIYSRLYKLNPRDPVARAVLVNMDSQTDPVSRETVLKLMINDHPDEAFLYFALGNVYAVQSRWAEAQQAFFDAYAKNSSNPDYALNLAISLDHIGQIKSALDYYNTALKLADEQSSGFDSATILARIQTLSAANIN